MIFDINEIINFRDISDYPICGEYVERGMVCRGSIPTTYNEDDLSMLKKLKITSFIDLRTIEEIAGNPFAYIDEFDYYICSLDNPSNPEVDIKKAYAEILEQKEVISQILKLVLNNAGGVFIGCGLGKDRTGIVLMLLLKILGATNDIIYIDYTMTEHLIHEKVLEIKKENPNAIIRRPQKKYINFCIHYLEDKYGSVYNYVDSLSPDCNFVKALQEKLLYFERWDIYSSDEHLLKKNILKSHALGKGEFHYVVNVWVKANDSYIITKRRRNKYQGNKWECVGGSVKAGELVEDACRREVQEELGIHIDDLVCIHKSVEESKIVLTYKANFPHDIYSIELSEKEISHILFVSKKEIKQLMDEDKFMTTISKRWPQYSGIL